MQGEEKKGESNLWSLTRGKPLVRLLRGRICPPSCCCPRFYACAGSTRCWGRGRSTQGLAEFDRGQGQGGEGGGHQPETDHHLRLAPAGQVEVVVQGAQRKRRLPPVYLK